MKDKKRTVTSFIVLMVFCIFAICILAVLLTGANVYGQLTDKQQTQYEYRTLAQYVTTRLRQADRAGAVQVKEFQGQSALILQEEIEGELYQTQIYCYEGYVRELFTVAGGEFSPEDGEKVFPARQLKFGLEHPRLTVQIVLEDGTCQELVLYLRSGREDHSEK